MQIHPNLPGPSQGGMPPHSQPPHPSIPLSPGGEMRPGQVQGPPPGLPPFGMPYGQPYGYVLTFVLTHSNCFVIIL